MNLATDCLLALGVGRVELDERRRLNLPDIIITPWRAHLRERAKRIAEKLRRRETMLVSRLEPEAVVRNKLKGALTTEMEQVAGSLVDAKVMSELKKHVVASLKEELDHVAKAIANGKLSEEEIRRLHEQFRRKAREVAHRRLAEAPDLADKVKEKLDARKAAKDGRGQDLAALTADGLPDVSAPLVALLLGAAKGRGAALRPVETKMRPGYFNDAGVRAAPDPRKPVVPPGPRPWSGATQPPVKPPFKTPRCEGIPFLAKFPKLDGDLSDWGRIRPLVLRPKKAGEQPVLVYAAWNYQGFLFGYQVKQPAERFVWPAPIKTAVPPGKVAAPDWALRGDHCRLMFDTLDARRKWRGDPHAQEFIILPGGTDAGHDIPGVEQIIISQRDAGTGEFRGVKVSGKTFLPQPRPEAGPDGSGPYRVCRFEKDRYTVEVFIPRTLFNVPVLAPGWYVGFDCVVAAGARPKGAGPNAPRGQAWAGGDPDRPDRWGDLLLLGTDPHFVAQDAAPKYPLTKSVIPGHSVLVTVVDPDRNVRVTQKDAVLVTCEVGGGARPRQNDVEVFILKETEKNSGVFRGYVNTQPGWGRQVHGVVEAVPGQELRLGYVGLADAAGRRHTVYSMRLPVVKAAAAGKKER